MALGYQNPFYLKQTQKKQQILYDGKVLLEKHDPPVIHDSEETLQLAQESRDKMKQINKEIKPANYTKINHLSGVFVPQTALSREELYFSNNSKMAIVSKSFSIPNEDLSDDTSPSVARKFLNEVKSTIVTLQRVVKQRMTIETHNWASSAHQEFHKIIREEIFPIVNQVDVRVQNFKLQFLKEAAKFVRDFKSLANEANASLAKHKALELEIERLLKAVVSQDILSVVKNASVIDTSVLQTELERMKECFENCIIKKESEYAKLWNDWYKKCDECKYDKISYDKAYNDMQQKIERLEAQLGDLKELDKLFLFILQAQFPGFDSIFHIPPRWDTTQPKPTIKDAIVVPAITTDNFELKHGLLTLVQNKQFFGHDKEDPHAHIRYINKITSTLKFPNVSNTSIKLMLFLFSLKGGARIWLEKEPPRSIFTWDDLVSKFINQFFPLSKTTNLHNEITNFQQRFDESFSEAWDRFKDLLRACPHYGFSKLHQLDTVYNALNSKDQDLLNSVTGGNFLDKMPRECLAIIESKSKVRYSHNKPVVAKVSTNTSTSGISSDVAELKDMVKALLLYKKSQNQAPATVKAVEESCVTCGGAYSYRNCLATDGNVYRDNILEFVSQASAVNYNQGNTSYCPPMKSNQIRTPGFPPVPNNQNVQLNQRNNQNRFNQNQNQGNNFNQGPVYQPSVFQPPAYQASAYQALAPQTQGVSKEDCSAYVKANDAVMRNISGTLPSNTIANMKSDLKAITTRSEVTKDTVHPTNTGSTKDVQPLVVQSKSPILTFEPVNSPIIELVASPFSPSIKSLLTNKDKIYELARTPLNEHCSVVLLKKFPEKLGDPELADRLISRPVGAAEDVYVKVGSFHFLANFVVVDFDADPRVPLILGRSFLKTERALIDVFEGELTLRVGKEAITFNLDQTSRYSANYNDMTAKRIDVIDMAYEEYSQEVLEAFLNDDPSLPPPNQGNYLPEVRKELKICEAKSDKSLIDEPLEVELKDLPSHLEYAFLEGDDKLPVIIAKDLSMEKKNALITVLKSHKRAIAWKLFDIKAPILIAPDWDMPFELMCNASDFAIGAVLGKRQDKHVRPIHYATPILIAPDWDMAFELMCNASDFAIGAVLGKRQDKHVRPIHYASKTMTEAESNYTTMEKEMLAVVYAFEKFRSYLIMNKSIVYMDHSALKYLFAKKDSKFAKVMQKFGVTHRLATPYHPQTSGQVEVSNRGLKCILKRTVGENRASWLDKLDDALWAF
nr:hypothetical protein [Tanacetum cinerariifolium]